MECLQQCEGSVRCELCAILLFLISHVSLAAVTRKIGVVLLNLLQAIAQGYPTPAARRRSPSMPTPSACTCARCPGLPSSRRLVAQSVDAPVATAPEAGAELRADEALVLVHAPSVRPRSERGMSVRSVSSGYGVLRRAVRLRVGKYADGEVGRRMGVPVRLLCEGY
jgi:hypothetical protein